MTDHLLIDGDIAQFVPTFGVAIVSVQPGTITGSGPATFSGKNICVVGDETSVSVPGCMYLAPPFVIPGAGTLEIASLNGDQIATRDTCGGKAIMLRGSQFIARFKVSAPAMMPPLAIPDPTLEYSGSGSFTTSNTKLRAT